MILRPLRPGDIEEIDRIWKKHHANHYGIPSRSNLIDEAVFADEQGMVGYGMVRLFAEGIIVLDKDRPLPTRAKAIILGINRALGSVEKTGLEKLNILTDDPHYIEVLQGQWGFKVAPETLLYSRG